MENKIKPNPLSDFLLNDAYWEKSKQKHRKMTPVEFQKETE